jgi:hypothetical protein
MASDSLNTDATPEEQQALELVLEAARRANWEALHGPAYLHSGRYTVAGEHVESQNSVPVDTTTEDAGRPTKVAFARR